VAKITVVAAISLKKIVGMMTLNGSIDGKAFFVFVEHFLIPNLWKGAAVVMDNLPAHSSGGN
jgi:transposase